MGTLLLRFAAPIQSWGVDSKYNTRYTGKEPSKSGVIGLIAAALGRRRDDSLDDLRSLKLGVRVDREGIILNDYHMIHASVNTITHRYYLQDAVFLVGLESDDEELLRTIGQSLENPRFPLYLGRRSCPPTLPIVLDISKLNLEESLKNTKSLTDSSRSKESVRIIMDTERGNANMHTNDVPISFDPAHRRFASRYTEERYIPVKTVTVYDTEHDPFSDLR